MATTTVYASSHITGNFSTPANANGAPDGTFTTDTGNVSRTSRWALGDPALEGGALSGTQTVTITLRRSGTGNGTPTYTVTLFENGTSVQQIASGTISTTGTQTVSGTFAASAITNPNNAEIEFAVTGNGGGPNAQTLQLDAIAWTVNYEQVAEPVQYDVTQGFTGTHTAAVALLITLGLSALVSTSSVDLVTTKSTVSNLSHESSSLVELEVNPTVGAYSNVLVFEATTEASGVSLEYTGTHALDFARYIEQVRPLEHTSVSSQELTTEASVSVYSNVLAFEATTTEGMAPQDVTSTHVSVLAKTPSYVRGFASSSALETAKTVDRVKPLAHASTNATEFTRQASHIRSPGVESVSTSVATKTGLYSRALNTTGTHGVGFERSALTGLGLSYNSWSAPEFAKTVTATRNITVESVSGVSTSVATSGAQEHDVTSHSTPAFYRVATLARSFDVSSVSEVETSAIADLVVNVEVGSNSVVGLARTYDFIRNYGSASVSSAEYNSVTSRTRSYNFTSQSSPGLSYTKHLTLSFEVATVSGLDVWHGVPGGTEIDVYSNVLVFNATTDEVAMYSNVLTFNAQTLNQDVTDVYSNVLNFAATTRPTFGIVTSGPYLHSTFVVLEVIGLTGPYTLRWSPSSSSPNAPGSVALTVHSESLDGLGDGVVTIIGDRGIVPYLETGYIWTTLGSSSTAFPAVLQLEGGKQAVTLTAPLVAPEFRLTAIPDLEPGDQVIWWDVAPSGDVVVLEDGSFNASTDVAFFDVEAHIPGLGYTATVTQSLTSGFELFLNVTSTHSVARVRNVTATIQAAFAGAHTVEPEVLRNPQVEREVSHTGTVAVTLNVSRSVGFTASHANEMAKTTEVTRTREFTGNHSTVIVDFTVSTPGLSTVNESFTGTHALGLTSLKNLTSSLGHVSTNVVGFQAVKNITVFAEFTSTNPTDFTLDPTNLVPRITSTSALRHNTQGVIVGENFGD